MHVCVCVCVCKCACVWTCLYVQSPAAHKPPNPHPWGHPGSVVLVFLSLCQHLRGLAQVHQHTHSSCMWPITSQQVSSPDQGKGTRPSHCHSFSVCCSFTSVLFHPISTFKELLSCHCLVILPSQVHPIASGAGKGRDVSKELKIPSQKQKELKSTVVKSSSVSG